MFGEKVKDYLTKAGTVIFIASILMWFLLNFGPSGYSADMSQTYGSLLGKWIVPFFAPIGLGYWQIVVALIAGISAKEVVVSSCAVLFGISNITSNAGMSAFMGTFEFHWLRRTERLCPDDLFPALHSLCATLATIKKETSAAGVGLD